MSNKLIWKILKARLKLWIKKQFKRVGKAIMWVLKPIGRFLVKKRYVGNYHKLREFILKASRIVAVVYIVSVPVFFQNIDSKEIATGALIDTKEKIIEIWTDFWTYKIVVEASVGTMVETEETETAVQDTISGIVEQEASNEVAPLTVEDKICAVFGEDCELMIAIAKAESGLKTDSIGYNCMYEGKSAVCKPEDKNLAWSVDCGVLQINHRGKVCPAELLEIDKNLEVGKKILNTQGLMAWSSFKANKHLKFM